jgi:hypothetical protein
VPWEESSGSTISRVTLNLTKLDRIAGRARLLGEEITPQLRALEAALEHDPELDEETPPSILLHCAVAFLLATEGRAATLHRLAQMIGCFPRAGIGKFDKLWAWRLGGIVIFPRRKDQNHETEQSDFFVVRCGHRERGVVCLASDECAYRGLQRPAHSFAG